MARIADPGAAANAYLQKYVRGTIHWLKSKPRFAHATDRVQAMKRARQALAVYRSLRVMPRIDPP